jgi:shikimate 5-dehydrogenase
MAKHYTKKEPRFQVEFRPSDQATAHGGQMAVNALFEQFGLWKRIQDANALEVRQHTGKGYDPVV